MYIFIPACYDTTFMKKHLFYKKALEPDLLDDFLHT
jgi:hypothetical protein